MNQIKKIGGFYDLDEDGFIVNPCEVEKIKEPWSSAISNLLESVVNLDKNNIFGVYLRGSIPRGLAIEDVSDVDIIIIMKKKSESFVDTWKKESEKKREDKNRISGYLNVVTQFLRDAKMELKKVKWPTRKELLASTAMVILLVLAVAIFLGLIDFGLKNIIIKIVG